MFSQATVLVCREHGRHRFDIDFTINGWPLATMITVEPNVTEEKLRTLLAEGHECVVLDFKRTFDPDKKSTWVELAKDVGAMQIQGGYIVLGVDDQGNPIQGLTAVQAQEIDEANLRNHFKKWIPEPFEIRSASHEVNGMLLGLIYVAPHEEGFCIFKADGQYDGKLVFRAGDVFARHGSASERWQQQDIPRIRARLRQRSDADTRGKIHAQALPTIRTVAGQCEGLLRDLIKASTLDFDLKTLRSSDLAKACSLVKPNDRAPLLIGNQYATWLDYLFYWRDRSQRFFHELEPTFSHLEADLLCLLMEIEHCSYFMQLDSLRGCGGSVRNRDLAWLASSLWKYLELTRRLKAAAMAVQSIHEAGRS